MSRHVLDPWVMFVDESSRGNLVTVGGYIIRARNVPDIATRWRNLKTTTFGIDPSLELKYNIAESHASRAPLDENGWTQALRVPAMLDCIAETDVTLIVNTQVDYRRKDSPADFYIDSLCWCIRRFCTAISTHGFPVGPHLVVVDKPPTPEEFEGRDVSERVREQYRGAATAAFERYQVLYWMPEAFSPSGKTAQSYRHHGLAPQLVSSHAKTSEPLQIADLIVGTVNEFVAYNLGKASGWGELPKTAYPDRNMAVIAWKLRRARNQVHRMGFDVFPPNELAHDHLIAYVERLSRRE